MNEDYHAKINWVLPRLLITTIILYYLKTAFWPLTFAFVASYALFFILFLFRFDWKFRFSGFIKAFVPPIILVAVYILIIVVDSQFLNPILQKDLFLIAVLFSFFYFLYWISVSIKTEDLNRFTLELIFYLTLIISVLNILNVVFSSQIPPSFYSKFHVSNGNTLAVDYNFYSLFILFGLLILYFNHKSESFTGRYSRLYIPLLYIVFIANIIFSGSRRGILVLFILLILYFLYEIFNRKTKHHFRIKKRNYLVLLISVILVISSSILIFNKIPKEKVSIMVYRYASIIGINDFGYINKKLWQPNNNISKKTYSLTNSNSIRIDNKSWKTTNIDITLSKTKTPYGSGTNLAFRSRLSGDYYIYNDMPTLIYLANHTYKISFKVKSITGDINSLNVGWLSDDGGYGNNYTYSFEKKIDSIGNGWYNYTSIYTFIDNHIGIVLFLDYLKDNSKFVLADFELKDLDFDAQIQKKLTFSKEYGEVLNSLNEINPPVENGPNLLMNGDFKHGFKYWTYNADSLSIKIEQGEFFNYAKISRKDGDGEYFSLLYIGRNIEFKKNNEYQIGFKVKPVIPKKIPFWVGYWVNEGQGAMINLNLLVDSLLDGWMDVRANYTFRESHNNLPFPINTQSDNSEFYIADIKLINLTQKQFLPRPIKFEPDILSTINLKPDTAYKETFFSGRISRWSYAIDIWKADYKWYNILFGNGFKFYTLFAQKFETSSAGDYPHNPFITILLYSGIFGLFIYCWLLYRIFYIYIYFRKQYAFLFIGFLITFFFSFLSGTQPFDPPIMGFFVMFPFYLYHLDRINKKV